jgi:hypothetical protein
LLFEIPRDEQDAVVDPVARDDRAEERGRRVQVTDHERRGAERGGRRDADRDDEQREQDGAAEVQREDERDERRGGDRRHQRAADDRMVLADRGDDAAREADLDAALARDHARARRRQRVEQLLAAADVGAGERGAHLDERGEAVRRHVARPRQRRLRARAGSDERVELRAIAARLPRVAVVERDVGGVGGELRGDEQVVERVSRALELG